MANPFTLDSLQALLFFPFKTADGKQKLLVAGLIGLASFIIPILPTFFLLGYSGLIMQRIIHEKAEPFMPEWKAWNEMLALGAKLGGAGFIYSFPSLIMIIAGYVGLMLPAFIEGLHSSQQYYGPSLFTGLELVGIFGGMAFFGIGILLSLVLWVVFPPMLGHVAATNSFSAAFRVREWWKIFRANPGGFIVTIILLGGLYMALMLVLQILYMTVILCIIVPFLMAFISAYLMIIANVLFAQAYREGIEKLAAQKA